MATSIDGTRFPSQLGNATNELRHLCIFENRIEELKAFKAKFGHCNVTSSRSPANMQYISLARWCTKIRRSRTLRDQGKKPSSHNLSEDQIAILDDIGFTWQVGETRRAFEDRIEELKAFKKNFGHCNVTLSRSPANKQYISLSRWCIGIRRSRTLRDHGEKPSSHNLSEDEIAILDDIGFTWQHNEWIEAPVHFWESH